MGVRMLIMSIMSVACGLAVGMWSSVPAKRKAEEMSQHARAWWSVLCIVPAIGGMLGLLWCLLTPPLFSEEVSGPPVYHRNDPSRSVYFGNGCFWHTQYDLVVLEQDNNSAFEGRSDENVTGLVGYAGGGLPWADYSKLGHAEVVSVTLDAITGPTAQAQLSALASVYFEHGFETVDKGRQRLDPHDAGPEYRNVIGLPGGMDNAELWPLIVAANTYGMPLIRGTGGTNDDTEDEYVAYVYDSLQYPFFRGEASHQFHPNTVVGRAVPKSYTYSLKRVQSEIGRLDSTGCASTFSEVELLIIFSFSLLIGLSIGVLHGIFIICFSSRLKTVDRT